MYLNIFELNWGERKKQDDKKFGMSTTVTTMTTTDDFFSLVDINLAKFDDCGSSTWNGNYPHPPSFSNLMSTLWASTFRLVHACIGSVGW